MTGPRQGGPVRYAIRLLPGSGRQNRKGTSWIDVPLLLQSGKLPGCRPTIRFRNRASRSSAPGRCRHAGSSVSGHGSPSQCPCRQPLSPIVVFPSATEATAAGTTAPAAATTAKSGPRPLLLRPGLTDRDRPVQKRCAVEGSYGLVTVLVIGHLDETEAL